MKEMAYLRVEKELLRMKKLVSRLLVDENGELVEIELSLHMKLVYKHMQDQYLFFKKLGKSYFENQDVIGEQLGLSERSVNSYIKQLVKVGLIEKRAKRMQGAMHSNSYVVHEIFDSTRFIPNGDTTNSAHRQHKESAVVDDFVDDALYLLAVQRQEDFDTYAAMQVLND